MFVDVFILIAKDLVSLLFFSLSSSCLLSLQCLSKFVAYLYHCSILIGEHSDSISFCLITSFIPLLNSFINNLFSYLLSLIIFLNSYTSFSIVLLPYSTFFNSTTFIVLLFPPPIFCSKSIRNSPTIVYTRLSLFKYSIMFYFQIPTDSPCIYNCIHCTYSSTATFLILIIIYNLHAIENTKTFSAITK